jgi:hypothetical protein
MPSVTPIERIAKGKRVRFRMCRFRLLAARVLSQLSRNEGSIRMETNCLPIHPQTDATQATPGIRLALLGSARSTLSFRRTYGDA